MTNRCWLFPPACLNDKDFSVGNESFVFGEKCDTSISGDWLEAGGFFAWTGSGRVHLYWSWLTNVPTSPGPGASHNSATITVDHSYSSPVQWPVSSLNITLTDTDLVTLPDGQLKFMGSRHSWREAAAADNKTNTTLAFFLTPIDVLSC